MVRAIKDKTFKARLLVDPTATLKEAAVDVPDGLAIKVVENTANQVYMVLPDSGDDRISNWSE
jgi:Nitrile hydratase, alpha chain